MVFNRKVLIKNVTIISIVLLLFLSCNYEKTLPKSTNSENYTIKGSRIYKNNTKIQLIGVNSLQVFGITPDLLKEWKIDINREFIGNSKENPITGNPIKDANGSYLYSLQNIVDSNRKENKITIICPFGWDGKSATLFTGKTPKQTYWWNEYKLILEQWAKHFKDQSDVWIEVWNEPYRYDKTDGYTDDIWFNDMSELTNIIRSTGNNNIILIPCAEQGQDESVLLQKGLIFIQNKSNILFDIHAYEKWLLDSNDNLNNRLNQLNKLNIPFIFGETAPMNAGVLMDPRPFLNNIYNRNLSICAWVCKKDENDIDALLTSEGLPNDLNNNNWGSFFKNLSLQNRNP
ncbi:cellulase family glycosylhydrolase [Flavobacterium nitratireducens]|uniref:cellulase family glycosylhydrolase n=1 Tax=Flavobacterium nitratireducens TaxID=992289 RepID=UPI002415167F|nr:cellulase family glycosylhydrolase [Flavobacterium nitratireducens]